MKKKLVVLAVVAALMLIGATLAFGGPGRVIYDDGAYVKPGSLGQVDLEHYEGRLVYTVDVGDHEIKVDAASGRIDGSVLRD